METFARVVSSCMVFPLLAAFACNFADEPEPSVSADQTAQMFAELMAEVEALRGLEFTREVPFDRLDAAGVDRYLTTVLERTGGAERLEFQGDVAKLLGWLAPERNLEVVVRELLVDQIAGLYDPPTERFYLAEGLHPAIVRLTMAHELVHALDDQHFDLGAAMDARLNNSDALWAYQAVAEGSATLVHNRWTMQNLATLSAEDMRTVQEQTTKGLSDAPEFLWKPLLGAYLAGAAFLVRTDDVLRAQLAQPRPGDVDRALVDPPRSSEQILHPHKYWNADQRDDPIAVDLDLGGLSAGWTSMGEDTLGEIGLAFATQRAAANAAFNPLALARLRFTHPAAAGWGGDRHVLLAREGARVLVNYLVFDSEADAGECKEALFGLGEWRAEALAAWARSAQTATLATPDETQAAAFGEWVDTVDSKHLRWVLFVGCGQAAAREAASGVGARVNATADPERVLEGAGESSR